jgi:type IV secretory pathway VirJ component
MYPPDRSPLAHGSGARRGVRSALCVLLLLAGGCATLEVGPELRAPPERVTFARFREVRLYGAGGARTRLALLLSGDGGWSAQLGSIAAGLAASGAVVAGVDVRDLLADYRRDPGSCVAPGEELAALGSFLVKRYRVSRSAPLLIGHSAGATIAYVALAQSAPGTFAGALTLSFCAELDLAAPLCPASALPSEPRPAGGRLRPASALPGLWIALHGLDDEVCPAADAREFVAAVPGAQFVGLPGITHTYRHPRRWWPQFAAAYAHLAGTPAPGWPGR